MLFPGVLHACISGSESLEYERVKGIFRLEASEWRARERSVDRSTRVGALGATRNESRQPDRENGREIQPICHPMAVIKRDVMFLGLASRSNYQKGGTCGKRRQDYARNTERDGKGEIDDIHTWCHRLYGYVFWKEDVVQTPFNQDIAERVLQFSYCVEHGW